MAIRQFCTGATYSLTFDFFNIAGNAIDVSAPFADIYTPERTVHISGLTLTSVSGITGQYTTDLFVSTAFTVGHWFAFPTGITQGVTVIADVRPFEVKDNKIEANWLSIEDIRDWIEEDPSDHTNDRLFKMVLDAAMELVEAHTGTVWGQCPHSETWQIKWADRRMLEKYPVVRISGITATLSGYTPRDTDNPNTESNAGSTTPFFYRLINNLGVMIYTDIDGLECTYDDTIISIDYVFGTASIPEPVRVATLMLTSKLLNICQSEGIDNLRISDMNFSIDRNLFVGEVGDLLKPYRRIGMFWKNG
jgi:hypothetical protein